MKSIYEAMKEAGVKTYRHESDLYVPITDKTTEILNKPEYWLNKKNSTKFRSSIDGTMFYDIPFSHDLFWENSNVRLQASGNTKTTKTK